MGYDDIYIHHVVCYTVTTNCTQTTASTVPYVPDDCCVTMNGVSYSDGSQCHTCPPGMPDNT